MAFATISVEKQDLAAELGGGIRGEIVEIYKQGEGKLVRRVSFYSLLALSVWGFKELGTFLASFGALNGVRFDVELPYYHQVLSTGLAISLALNVAFGFWLFKLLNRQQTAAVLIDTETEMQKVSWPTWPEAKHATVIVLLFVVFCAVFLTLSELSLKWCFDRILFAFN